MVLLKNRRDSRFSLYFNNPVNRTLTSRASTWIFFSNRLSLNVSELFSCHKPDIVRKLNDDDSEISFGKGRILATKLCENCIIIELKKNVCRRKSFSVKNIKFCREKRDLEFIMILLAFHLRLEPRPSAVKNFFVSSIKA